MDRLTIKVATTSALGARPMKRTLARFIEAPLAEQLLNGTVTTAMTAMFSLENGELRLAAAP